MVRFFYVQMVKNILKYNFNNANLDYLFNHQILPFKTIAKLTQAK